MNGIVRRWLARSAALAATGAIVASAPSLVRWLEALYPLQGGAAAIGAQYVAASLVTVLLAAGTLGPWLYPSWMIAARFRPDDSIEVRAVRATVVAFFLQPAVHTVIIGVTGRASDPVAYRTWTLATQLALVIAAMFLAPREAARRDWAGRATAVVVVGTMVALALVGRVAWADLNPDGTELLTLGRTLSSFVLPRLPTGEIPGVNLGMLTSGYPIDWLLAVVGSSPAAVRLPALAYATLAGIGLAALVERDARRRLSTLEFGLLLGGVAAVCLTIGFNASYDPYSTDLGSPASIDMLSLVFLVAVLYFVFAGETGWCIAASILQAITRPSALLICVMLVAAILLVERDLRSPRFRLALAALVTTVLITLGYALGIEALTGSEVAESGGRLLLRVRFIRFDDWRRLAWLIVPCGILPALLMPLWRRLDDQARTLTLVTLAYFAFFYFLAFVALHHFAPAMFLPLSVFWRHESQRERRASAPWLAATGAGMLVAIVAAFPRTLEPYRSNRRVAATIAFDIGNERGYAAIRNEFDASRALDSLFTPFWRVTDPRRERVGAPLSLAWYALRANPGRDTALFIVQPADRPAPEGTTLLGIARGYALHARDTALARRIRSIAPPPDPRSRLYDVPPTTLFQHLGREESVQLDLRNVACRILPSLSRCAVAP